MQKYIEAVQNCLNQSKEMLVLESEKRRALLGNIGKDIDAVMKKQQAALMKLEMLEQQRIKAQTELGYSETTTAAEILQALPESEQKQTLQKLLRELKECASELQEQNKDCMELARLDLQLIESLRVGSGQQPTGSGIYSRSQAAAKPVKSKFEGSF